MNKHLLLTIIGLLSVSILWAAKPVKKSKKVKEDPYAASVAEVDSLFYILDDEKETATVTVPSDRNYYVGMKEIPEVIKVKRHLYSVVAVGEGAFEGCKGLTGVKFPATVVTIGDRAFKDCTKLKNITFPTDLVSLGTEAFMNSGVRAAKLPKTVLEMGDRAFAGTPVKSASFGREMTAIPEGAFQGCRELTKVTISDGITEIEEDAFADCISLQNVVVPEGVTTLSKRAFKGCSALMSAKLPQSLKKLEDEAFADCAALQTVNLPAGLEKVGNEVFRGCVAIPNALVFGSTLLLVPTSESGEYVVPDNIKSIAGGAFSGCNNITAVRFHGGISELVKHTFIGCNGIERIDLPRSIRKVEDEAFLNCTGLRFVIVRGETEVADEAFAGCYNLTSIVHNN